MKFNENKEVLSLIQSFPRDVKINLEFLRGLIIETARETQGIDSLEENLKWGEPAYLTKSGSTVRIGWKKSNPDQVAMYFHCQTTLIETFRELYRELFQFDGNRAIIFKIGATIPTQELKHCILLSLTYHKRKHLWMLGA